jgi:hypothetical protein
MPRRLFHCGLFLAAAMVPAAPAGAQDFSCRADQKRAAVAELMFGRNIGDRLGVSDAAWSRFLDREIVPRFPDGLTVIDAVGRWRDPDRNRLVREPSKIVTIVLRDRERDQAALDAIAAAYKTRFRQQSVGIVVRPACVAF